MNGIAIYHTIYDTLAASTPRLHSFSINALDYLPLIEVVDIIILNRVFTSKANSATWVMLCMQIFEALAGHMCVYLRGGQVRMTKQQLYNPQIGAMVQQV